MSATEEPLSKASTSVANVGAQKSTVSFPLGRKMMLPSVAILIFFVIVVFIVLSSISKMQSQFEAVLAQDVKALHNVMQLSQLIYSMESAQKNYVVTGNQEFLSAYQDSKKEFIDVLEKFKVFSGKDQKQLQQLEHIESLITLWQQRVAIPEMEMGKKISQHTIGADYLQQVLRKGTGNKITNDLQTKLNELRQQFRDVDDIAGEMKVLEVAKDVADMENGQRGFIITGHENFLKPFNRGVRRVNTHIIQLRNRLQEYSNKNPLVEDIDRLVKHWIAQAGLPEIKARNEMNQYPESFKDLSVMLQNQVGRNILDDLKYNLDQLGIDHEKRMAISFAEATTAASTAQILSIILTGLAIVVSFFMVTFITRSVTNPLSTLVVSADKIRDGIFDDSISIQTNDEIGVLGHAFDDMRIGLKQSYNRLEEKTLELEEFAYRTSHDLRSPLVSSIALIDLAQNAIADNKPKLALKSLGHSQSSLTKLEALVKDILVLTKTNNLEEQEEQVDVEHHVEETLNKFCNMENFERLDIQMDFQFKDPINVKKNRMVLVIENMISNAIKYQDTQEESSYIKISTYAEDQHLVFEVKDNGLGIPKAQQGKLFTMFKRFHRVSFGSGLGLYMTEKSAIIMGGRISYEDPGKGSIFKLIVPVSLGKQDFNNDPD